MEQLSKDYLDRLNQIKTEIQESEILARYLEEEEDELYKELADQFEPAINDLHEEIAEKNPLQIISFEKELLDPALEGLFLPRIIGYSVMRGEINSDYKYKRPQDHFKDVLLTICNSANFDQLKRRIGQSIQIGFALSSDIWITNLLNNIDNKFVLSYLRSQQLEKFRDLRSRHTFYRKYKKQFEGFNYQTADFPESVSDLKSGYNQLKSFLLYRANADYNNTSLMPFIRDFLSNEQFIKYSEYTELLMSISMFFALEGDDAGLAASKIDWLRDNRKDFKTEYFNLLVGMLRDVEVPIAAEQDQRISNLINKDKKDELTKYYNQTDTVHGLGYIHEDAIEAVRNYYYQHKGLSVQNECVRLTILQYFSSLLQNLEETSYQDYFELNKVFIQYMNIFSNEKFNQQVKAYSLDYVKRLLKHFADKRAKDYQDIKKYVSTTFADLGFLKPKEIAELFKTRRKRRAS